MVLKKTPALLTSITLQSNLNSRPQSVTDQQSSESQFAKRHAERTIIPLPSEFHRQRTSGEAEALRFPLKEKACRQQRGNHSGLSVNNHILQYAPIEKEIEEIVRGVTAKGSSLDLQSPVSISRVQSRRSRSMKIRAAPRVQRKVIPPRVSGA